MRNAGRGLAGLGGTGGARPCLGPDEGGGGRQLTAGGGGVSRFSARTHAGGAVSALHQTPAGCALGWVRVVSWSARALPCGLRVERERKDGERESCGARDSEGRRAPLSHCSYFVSLSLSLLLSLRHMLRPSLLAAAAAAFTAGVAAYVPPLNPVRVGGGRGRGMRVCVCDRGRGARGGMAATAILLQQARAPHTIHPQKTHRPPHPPRSKHSSRGEFVEGVPGG